MIHTRGCRREYLMTLGLLVTLVLTLGRFTLMAHAQEGAQEGTAPVETAPEVPATPEPEATPTPVSGQSSDGELPVLFFIPFLDWTLNQWTDVGISLLIFLAIAGSGGHILTWLWGQVAKRTNTTADDRLISSSRKPLQWFGITLGFQIAYKRLDFLNPAWQQFFDSLSFILYVMIAGVIIWKLIDYGLPIYRELALEKDADIKSIDRLLPLARTFAKGLLVIVCFIIILNHFGIEITAAIAALGISGFALSLAAKDTLTNLISGIIIAFDRPFRIGDRIYSSSVKGWVDVVEIGLRSTKVHTRDNRMIVIPNSLLADAAVINYNYPSRHYRLQVDIDVAYGTAFEKVRQVLHDAVRQVEGVMPDKPVQILFVAFGDSAMVFRVRWWIADYADMRQMNDRVYQAIQEALDTHGIVSPGQIYDVNYHLGQQDADRLAQIFQNEPTR